MTRSESSSWNHQSVTANGVQIHFVREGSGAPLLLIHGWPGFWFDWNRNLAALALNFDCIAPDLRGFGFSGKPDLPPESGYNDGAIATDILDMINELGLAKIGILATNFGALYAQRFARSHPERVSGMVLLTPPYLGIGQRWREPQHGPNFWWQYFMNLDWSHETVSSSRKTLEPFIRHFLVEWCRVKEGMTEEDIQEYVESYSHPEVVHRCFDYFRAAFRGGQQIVLPSEKLIGVPTLVLWAENDPCIPVRWSDRLGEYFTNLKFESVPGCGHYMQRELPEMVNKRTIAFFRGIRD